MDGWVGGQADGWMDGQACRLMGRWMDGWTDIQIYR